MQTWCYRGSKKQSGSPDLSLSIFAIVPFFLLLPAPLRRCPSSSSVMVKRAGVAERLPALRRLLLPLRQPPPLPRFSCLLLCGIASCAAQPASQPVANSASPSPSSAARHTPVDAEGWRGAPKSRLLSRKEGSQEKRTTASSSARA